MNTLRETAETFALNQWLSDYPADMSYAEIIEQISANKHRYSSCVDEIYVWVVAEDFSGRELAETIDDTRNAFMRHAGELLSCTHE